MLNLNTVLTKSITTKYVQDIKMLKERNQQLIEKERDTKKLNNDLKTKIAQLEAENYNFMTTHNDMIETKNQEMMKAVHDAKLNSVHMEIGKRQKDFE